MAEDKETRAPSPKPSYFYVTVKALRAGLNRERTERASEVHTEGPFQAVQPASKVFDLRLFADLGGEPPERYDPRVLLVVNNAPPVSIRED